MDRVVDSVSQRGDWHVRSFGNWNWRFDENTYHMIHATHDNWFESNCNWVLLMERISIHTIWISKIHEGNHLHMIYVPGAVIIFHGCQNTHFFSNTSKVCMRRNSANNTISSCNDRFTLIHMFKLIFSVAFNFVWHFMIDLVVWWPHKCINKRELPHKSILSTHFIFLADVWPHYSFSDASKICRTSISNQFYTIPAIDCNWHARDT